jgi:hypothetical protein
VVTPRGETGEPVGIGGMAGERDYRDLYRFGIFTEGAGEFEPGAIGQPEIEDDQTGQLTRYRIERLGGAPGLMDVVPGILEEEAKGATQELVIFDEEDQVPAR